MNDMIKAAAEQFARENVKEAQNLLRTLGKIPAPSHDEGRRAAFVSEWFKSQGFKDVQIDAAQNVICKLGPQDGDLVVFAAHTDIVFPDTAPLPMREEDGRLYAPGIGDDTANLVNLMIAARHLARREDELTQGVLIVANACEEGLGNLDGTKATGGASKPFTRSTASLATAAVAPSDPIVTASRAGPRAAIPTPTSATPTPSSAWRT